VEPYESFFNRLFETKSSLMEVIDKLPMLTDAGTAAGLFGMIALQVSLSLRPPSPGEL
jgi:hypothetical protein